MAAIDGPSTPASEGDTDFSRGIIIVILVPHITSGLVAGLRFLVRLRIVKAFGWDDWAMVFAMASSPAGMTRSAK